MRRAGIALVLGAVLGVWGNVPSTLPAGEWTVSFRLWYGSDAIQSVPVPGGTPRAREEDPFVAACSAHFETAALARVTMNVAFQGNACTVDLVTA